MALNPNSTHCQTLFVSKLCTFFKDNILQLWIYVPYKKLKKEVFSGHRLLWHGGCVGQGAKALLICHLYISWILLYPVLHLLYRFLKKCSFSRNSSLGLVQHINSLQWLLLKPFLDGNGFFYGD